MYCNRTGRSSKSFQLAGSSIADRKPSTAYVNLPVGAHTLATPQLDIGTLGDGRKSSLERGSPVMPDFHISAKLLAVAHQNISVMQTVFKIRGKRGQNFTFCWRSFAVDRENRNRYHERAEGSPRKVNLGVVTQPKFTTLSRRPHDVISRYRPTQEPTYGKCPQ